MACVVVSVDTHHGLAILPICCQNRDMEFAKCKLCGERHGAGPCPSFFSRYSGVISSRGGSSTRKSAVGEGGALMPLSVETDPATGGTARKAPIARSTKLDKPQSGKEHRPDPRETKRRPGRPRIGESRDQPWVSLGMSERTWYRRQADLKKMAR